VITPGPRVPAALGAYVAYRDGVPVESEESSPIGETPIRDHRSAASLIGGGLGGS
jgi:hypothetical protein